MLEMVVVPMLLAQVVPAAPRVPAPPPVVVPPIVALPPHPWPPPEAASIASYAMSMATCGGDVVTPLGVVAPRTIVEWDPASASRLTSPVTLTFRIDDNGRPLTIRRNLSGVRPDVGAEMEATLSAMRFRAGGVRQGCSATFSSTVTPVATADADLLYRALRDNEMGLPGMQQVWTRLGLPVTGACDEGTPDPLLVRYPDFLPERRPPGQPLGAIVSFSIGADGVPYDVKLIRGSGNADYDRLEVEATLGSRFERKPFTRCFRGGTLHPPVMTIAADTMAETLASSDCPRVQWAEQPVAGVPEDFRRRGIEGWAIVGFDTDTNGMPMNVRMLRAEPADAFGIAEITAVKGGRITQGARHGCTQRMSFRVAD